MLQVMNCILRSSPGAVLFSGTTAKRKLGITNISNQSAELLANVHSKDLKKWGPKPPPYSTDSIHLELVLQVWFVAFYLADMQRLVSLETASWKSRVKSNHDSDINVHVPQPVSLAESAQPT